MRSLVKIRRSFPQKWHVSLSCHSGGARCVLLELPSNCICQEFKRTFSNLQKRLFAARKRLRIPGCPGILFRRSSEGKFSHVSRLSCIRHLTRTSPDCGCNLRRCTRATHGGIEPLRESSGVGPNPRGVTTQATRKLGNSLLKISGNASRDQAAAASELNVYWPRMAAASVRSQPARILTLLGKAVSLGKTVSHLAEAASTSKRPTRSSRAGCALSRLQESTLNLKTAIVKFGRLARNGDPFPPN